MLSFPSSGRRSIARNSSDCPEISRARSLEGGFFFFTLVWWNYSLPKKNEKTPFLFYRMEMDRMI